MTQTIRFELNPPIVIKRRTKKRRKKKRLRTPGLQETLDAERYLARAMHRTATSVDQGMAAYRKARKKSAKKKPERVIWDFIPNTMVGTAKMSRGLTRVPVDVVKAFYSRRTRRMMRRSLQNGTRLVAETLFP